MPGDFLFVFSDGARVGIERSFVEGLKRHYTDEQLSRRISTSLWIEAAALNHRYGINFLSMLQPIFDLENGTNLSRTKAATPFTREPLRGLWHKHFFSGRFVAANIASGLRGKGIEKIVTDVLGEPDGSKTISREDIAEIARRVVEEPLNHRSSKRIMTGEWIIYLPRREGNIYLSIGTHSTPDDIHYRNVIENGSRDFPDLLKWLNVAKSEE
ncbi:hypothetical protein G6L34_01970 [Agrobacterium tumefaciens]|uniref:hypothetical protein n=1 Tax=Agrobacterium tumefaciens TaxID=358 RepID=UPI001573BEA4|nr:hypothetical protein [Agrobacterium tumefaciens]NTA46859.1 hypothetical protein [Agrobacterium tumefaciens]